MNKTILLLLLLVACASSTVNQNILQSLGEVQKRHPESSLGFYAFDITANSALVAFNEKTNLAPASTLKTLTTATALEILGAEFTFKTNILYSGIIKNGVLEGNLIINPSGDPTLGSKYFEKTNKPQVFEAFVLALKELGITALNGKIILNTENFETERVPANWSYDDLGNYYGASLSPLNCFDNTLLLTFASGPEAGATKLLSVKPEVPNLTFTNEVKSANINYDNAFVFGAPNQYNRVLRGQIPMNRKAFSIKASVPEPELFALQQLVKELREAQIEVPVGAISFNHEFLKNLELIPLAQITSPSLAEIVKIINVESNNLFAEALLKSLALQKDGFWSREKGIELIKSFWATKGISLESANIYDGSGLSRFNNLSTKTLADVLAYMYQSPNKTVFYNSLPIAGVSGSISVMFKGTKAANNLRAKSGYIEKVRSYCGYVTGSNGHVYCFSIMVNNYACGATEMRNEIETILSNLAL